MVLSRWSSLIWLLVILQANLSRSFMASMKAKSAFGNNCTLRQSCSLSPDVTSRSMNCACDDSCTSYGDCCADFEPEVEMPPLDDDDFEIMECMDVPSINTIPIYITNRCPADFEDEYTRDRCESMMANLPITPAKLAKDATLFTPVSSTATTQLFVNPYCAVCNGQHNFLFWNIEFLYTDNYDINDLVNASVDLAAFTSTFPQYQMRISLPGVSAHPCKIGTVRTCAGGWEDEDTRRQCEEGTTLYVYRSRPYKNHACALCNRVPETLLSCRDPRENYNSMPFVTPSFSILFDFNSGFSGVKSYTDDTMVGHRSEACREGSIYDPFQEKCITLFCPDEASQFVNGTCMYNETHTSDQFPFCPQTILEKHQYQKLPNGSLEVPVWNVVLDKSEYLLDDATSQLHVCVPLMPQTSALVQALRFDAAQGYLTAVGNTVSVLCLSLHLAVYSTYSSLRNRPGKCIMCLAASLLFSQFLFMIGIGAVKPHELCYIIALLLHYGFLAYFFWMNVMAYDVWQTFMRVQSMQNAGEKSRSRRFLAYSLYAWGAPLVIVLISLTLDLSSASIRPHYAESLCWFSDRQGLLYSFALPLSLILVTDLILFLWTVHSIYRVSVASSAARPDAGQRRNLALYVKLACIMGLTWITAFLAALTEINAIWYLFVILNSFQGVWIFLAFVCTKKVCRLLTSSWNRRKGVKLTEASKTKSTSSTQLNSTSVTPISARNGHRISSAVSSC